MPNTSNSKPNDAFQPQEHLEQRDGIKILPLKWRLVWLRSEHPEAQIVSRLVSHEDGVAVFQTRIKLGNGATATGFGAKSRLTDNQSEPDLSYITEAENQALIRALTVLGYGAEYPTEFDAPVEQDHISLADIAITVPDLPIARNAAPVIITSTQLENRVAEPKAPAYETDEDDEDDEDTDVEPEDDEDNVAPGKTNLRPITGNQGTATNTRPPASITPLPLPPTPIRSNTTATTARRPAAPIPTTPAAVSNTAGTGTNVGSNAVNERLRGIDDSALRLAIKQIYNEARRLYNLDEETVDRRSVRAYGRPANELNREEAEEYLERIKNGRPRSQ